MSDIAGAIRIGIAVYRLAQRRIQVIGSTAWPMANGRIFDSSVQHDDIHGWAAELTYSYIVFGEYYPGNYRRGYRRKKRAEAFLERLPRETPTTRRKSRASLDRTGEGARPRMARPGPSIGILLLPS